MKKWLMACFTLALTVTCSVSAFAMEVPEDVTVQNLDGVRQCVKTFTVPPDTDPQSLLEESFTRDGYTYTYDRITKKENRYSDKAQYTETVTVNTASKDLAAVLAALPTRVEYDDGTYRGALFLEYPTLRTEASGYTTKSRTLQVTKEIENLDSNDMAYVPASASKDGVELPLQSVDWQVQVAALVDDVLVPSQYQAVAVYAGKTYYRAATGYITTAEYRGEVTAEGIESITYTVTYTGAASSPAAVLREFSAAAAEHGVVLWGMTLLLAGVVIWGMFRRERRNKSKVACLESGRAREKEEYHEN